MADTKQSGSVRCVIVTPEQTSLDTQARSVTLPLFDGLRGVGHGHAPFIGRLGAGEVRIVGEQGGRPTPSAGCSWRAASWRSVTMR